MPSTVRRLAATVALLAIAASGAQAQTELSSTTHLSGSNGPRVATMTFDVLTAGTFRMYTMGPSIDPNLWLFAGGYGSLGEALAFDDDGCPNSLCGPAGSYSNSLIDEFVLGTGTYTLVAGSHSLSEGEARTGDADLTGDGNVTLRVTSSNGAAVTGTSTVPEPGTWALLGTGLVGLATIARRRRSA